MNPFAIAFLQLDELFEFLKDDAVGVAFYVEENEMGQYLVAKKAISSGGALRIIAGDFFPLDRIAIDYPTDGKGQRVTHFEFLEDRKKMGLAYFSIGQLRMMRPRGNKIALFGGMLEMGSEDTGRKQLSGKYITLMAEVVDPVKVGPNDHYDPEAPAYEPLSFAAGMPCPPSWNNFGGE